VSDVDLGVLFVHGMGEADPDYWHGCARELKAYLGRAAAKRCVFGGAHWAQDFNAAERDLMSRVSPKVDKNRIRSGLVVGGLGDATQYLAARATGSPGFLRVQQRITDAICAMQGERESLPFVVLSHSLGCLVVADYIKTGAHGGQLRSWITFGCNLPLFYVAGHGMEVPPPLARLKDGSRPWINVYDPDDVLGYPVAALDDQHGSICRDFAINTGGLARAHNGYWRDNDFVALAGDHIQRARKALCV
jgi:hypothetical protein